MCAVVLGAESLLHPACPWLWCAEGPQAEPLPWGCLSGNFRQSAGNSSRWCLPESGGWPVRRDTGQSEAETLGKSMACMQSQHSGLSKPRGESCWDDRLSKPWKSLSWSMTAAHEMATHVTGTQPLCTRMRGLPVQPPTPAQPAWRSREALPVCAPGWGCSPKKGPRGLPEPRWLRGAAGRQGSCPHLVS